MLLYLVDLKINQDFGSSINLVISGFSSMNGSSIAINFSGANINFDQEAFFYRFRPEFFAQINR
jgi:hypothetical protein